MQKKFLESARQYESFAAQNPKSSLALTALFNAGVNYERVGQGPDSLRNFNKVISSKDPGAGPLKSKIRRVMAKLYQDMGRFPESAKLFREMAREDVKSPESLNFLFNAAVLFEASAMNAQALEAYSEYSKSAKKNSEKSEAFWAMGEIYRRTNKLSLAGKAYEEYLSVGNLDARAVQAGFNVYQISKRLKKITATKEWRAKVLNMQRRVSQAGTAKYAARIYFEDSLEIFEELKEIKIPQDPRRQKIALDRKIDLLKKINSEVQKLIKFDSAEEIVDALVLLGESQEHMFQAIVQAPIPKGLTPEETKQYRDGVENLAKPFLSQAKEAYRTAVSRGRELEAYGSQYQEAYFKNLKLNPPSEGQPQQNGYGEVGLETYYLNWTVK